MLTYSNPRLRLVAAAALLSVPVLAVGCGDDRPSPIPFTEPGSAGGASGRGSFTFGAATAAAQIEEDNSASDWWVFTLPESEGGEGNGEFVGEAVQGYARVNDDLALVREMNLDAYRFSVNWARMEPTRDVYDQSAWTHYDDQLDEMLRLGIKPMVTVHHFSSPIWVDDPRESGCGVDGPVDAHLCGWGHPTGGPQIVEEIAEFAGELARRYGDRVDEWVTLNEPVNYLVAAYGVGVFPPGRALLLNFDSFVQVIRTFIDAHVAAYNAILANDTVDADGDGQNATVGITLNTIEWIASALNMPSELEGPQRAQATLNYVYNHVFVDTILNGTFDPNFDQVAEESQPDWEGRLDFLGVQNYSRQGVTGPGLIPVLNVTPCFDAFDSGSCVEPLNDDTTHCIPEMGYEWAEESIYKILTDFGQRWPDLPLTITESGIATNEGARRTEHIVRTLEQIMRARSEGVDLRGYYHWSLTDNFEWAEGYGPHFGLYRVNAAGGDYARTATGGAITLGEIAGARRLTTEQRVTSGGLGPMTPEPGAPAMYLPGCRSE